MAQQRASSGLPAIRPGNPCPNGSIGCARCAALGDGFGLTAVDQVPTGQSRLATKSVRLVSNERALAVQTDPLALGVPAIVRWLSQGRPALVNAWSRYVS